MSHVANPVISACWIIFILWWVVAAFRVKPTAGRQSLVAVLGHRLPVIIGWVLMVYHKFPAPLNRQWIPRTPVSLVTGTVMVMGGLLVALWARYALAGNWSSIVTLKQGHELIRRGPYRFARHPIYTGLLLMWLGTAIDVGQPRAFLAVLSVIIGFCIKLRQEERLMLEHFPADYPQYRQQVKALVPFVV